MFKTYKNLKGNGILSINQRNADFILRYNPRNLYPIVDDKLKTKVLALNAAMAVPQLYSVIESEHQLRNLKEILAPYTDFVVKPTHGSGGDGIVVIVNTLKGRYRKANGGLMTAEDLNYHISCLLSGAYSLGGHPDSAFIEQRVIVDPIFEPVSVEGVPDVRVIVLLGYPVMAMVRLPTRASEGRANLHQGAIGVGIHLATGITSGGVLGNEPIDSHPDTLNAIAGIEIPYWDKILHLAASCYELTGLGYIGVDIVLDKTSGPLILELNARPGLNIQIANREGLLHRCRSIEREAGQTRTASERIDVSVALFKKSFA